MKPETDLVLRIDASSEVCKTQVTDFQAEVLGDGAAVRQHDQPVAQGRGRRPAAFPAGPVRQDPGAGRAGSARSYSFSSPPGSEVATFLIRNVPGGLMSGYLTERAKPGDKLTLKGPLGSFYLRDTKRPVLMLAGGTGLAPFLSMLGKVAETRLRPADPSGLRRHQRRRSGRGRDASRSYAKPHPELHLRHLRRRQGQQPSAQGLRHRIISRPST